MYVPVPIRENHLHVCRVIVKSHFKWFQQVAYAECLVVMEKLLSCSEQHIKITNGMNKQAQPGPERCEKTQIRAARPTTHSGGTSHHAGSPSIIRLKSQSQLGV